MSLMFPLTAQAVCSGCFPFEIRASSSKVSVNLWQTIEAAGWLVGFSLSVAERSIKVSFLQNILACCDIDIQRTPTLSLPQLLGQELHNRAHTKHSLPHFSAQSQMQVLTVQT